MKIKNLEILKTDKYLFINNILLNNKWVKEIKGGLENTSKWMNEKLDLSKFVDADKAELTR